MRLSFIRKKAGELGLADTWKYSKRELIRMIQTVEGNPACFGASGDCGQGSCLWFEDCRFPRLISC